VADFEREQATAALPSITKTATLRRIADQAAAQAEDAASKAPASQQDEARAQAIARAAEATNLAQRPVHAPRSPFLLSTTPGLFPLGERRS
jgi:hypothetical protein